MLLLRRLVNSLITRLFIKRLLSFAFQQNNTFARNLKIIITISFVVERCSFLHTYSVF